MKAEDLVNNNSLTNVEVTGGDTVVCTGIALTAINMARMEERENVLRWISVKERLPELNENVLLLMEGVPVIGLGENVKDESLYHALDANTGTKRIDHENVISRFTSPLRAGRIDSRFLRNAETKA